MVLDTGVDLRKQLGRGDSKASLQFRRELRPEGFIKTWAEWAAIDRQQIWRNGLRTSNGTTVLFTVPQGHQLFITSAYINAQVKVGTGNSGSYFLETNEKVGQNMIFSIFLTDGVQAAKTGLALSFPMPLIIQSGVSVQLRTSESLAFGAAAGFHGWLEPKKI